MTTNIINLTKYFNDTEAGRKLRSLYALSDRERFPASQAADGLERPDTLFWADFSVADHYGLKAIRETFDNCRFTERGYKDVTELAVVLNHKLWEWCDKIERAANESLKRAYECVYALYSAYYKIVEDWAVENLKGDEAHHYWAVMD